MPDRESSDAARQTERRVTASRGAGFDRSRRTAPRGARSTAGDGTYVPEPLEPRVLLSGIAFDDPVTYDAGSGATAVTPADLNGDGRPDVVVANFDKGRVSVLLNGGDGTLAPRVEYPTNPFPVALAVADVDADGHPDLAVLDGSAGAVSILRNNGDGTFAAKLDYPAAAGARAVTSADLNGDGRPDLAVANANAGNTVDVLLNRGDGTFADRVAYATGGVPTALATADLDGDGRQDLAVANSASRTVSVLRNQGDGTFAAKVDFPAAAQLHTIATADFDRDGRPDLAAAGLFGGLTVLRNNGDGTFTAATYAAGTSSLVSADLDGDGSADLVSVVANSGAVSVLRNNGDGTFAAKVDFAFGIPTSPTTGVTAADFNGDGSPDLAPTSATNETVIIARNHNDFAPRALPPTLAPAPYALTLAFSEGVGPSLAPTDLVVTPRSGSGSPVSPGSVTFDPTTNTARFTFAAPLPDGDYRATIPAAGVVDAAGQSMAADLTLDFFVLTGDANRDRVVNFSDLAILAQNYNQSGKTFAQGDFNGDGVVNFSDLAILAQRYNQSLPAPAPSVTAATSVAPSTAASVLRDDGDDTARPVFLTTRVASRCPLR